MDYFGYAGEILRVDLASEKVFSEDLPLQLATDFIGGWGANFSLYHSVSKPRTDPLSPDNPIVIGTGPLVGTITPSAAKIVGTTKLPLSGTVSGVVGGSRKFGLMLKSAGYDHLVITGAARRPSFLLIEDERTDICDARAIWGKKDLYKTTDLLAAKYGGGVIAIGRSGEKQVKFSMSMVDKSTLGRGGFGAVMGSKNLKAIVVRGSSGVKVHDRRSFIAQVKELRKDILVHPTFESARKLTVSMAEWYIYIKVFNEGVWSRDVWDQAYGVGAFSKSVDRVHSCATCMVPCKASFLIRDGEYAGDGTETGHFTCISALGQRLEIRDYREAIKLMDVLNRLGLCYMTFSGIVDFLTRMDAQSRVKSGRIHGVKLARNLGSYLNLAGMIANRRSIGNVLADGWDSASKLIGVDYKSEYIQGRGVVKETDCIYDGRFRRLSPCAFTQIVNPRGGHQPYCHAATSIPMQPIEVIKRDCENMGVTEDSLSRIFYENDFSVGRLTKHIEDAYAVYSSLGTCSIYAIAGFLTVVRLAPLYTAVTGIEVTPQDLKLRGERAVNLQRILNVMEGFSRKDDIVPRIWFKARDTPDGEARLLDYYERKELTPDDIHRSIDEYYEERGWSLDEGIPKAETLAKLSLMDYANAIEVI